MTVLVRLLALVGHPTGQHTLVTGKAGALTKQAVWVLPLLVRWPLEEG